MCKYGTIYVYRTTGVADRKRPRVEARGSRSFHDETVERTGHTPFEGAPPAAFHCDTCESATITPTLARRRPMIGPCNNRQGISMIRWLPQSKLCPGAKKYLLIAAVFVSSCAISGCVESIFTLASESRLPRCMTFPPGLTREDVSVTLEYNAPMRPSSDDAKFALRDKKGKELAEAKGKVNNRTIVANGITETIGYAGVIIIHGTAESIFYFNDNPAIKELYEGLPICSKNLKEMSKKWSGGPCRDRAY